MARSLEGLLGNPMFMAGLGLIGSNSWGGAAQGLLSAAAQRQAMAQGEREQQLYDLKMREAQAKEQEMMAAQQSRAQLAQMYPQLAPLIAAGGDVTQLLKPQTLSPGTMMVGPGGNILAQNPGNELSFDQRMQLAKARGGSAAAMPANVQEWEYFSKLPPEKQTQYLTMKRAQQNIDLGGSVVAPDMANPAGMPVAVFGKTPPPQDMPEFKAAQTTAVTRAESAAKKQASMSGINDILNQAEQILVNSKPTGSGAGAMTDAVMGFAGVGTDSAAAADSLEAIGGALVAKMPRMEGPQSNYDVESYRVMAGRVGDRSLPVSRRLAALRTVRQLWAKYEHLNRDAPTDAAPAGGGRSIDDLLNKYGTQ